MFNFLKKKVTYEPPDFVDIRLNINSVVLEGFQTTIVAKSRIEGNEVGIKVLVKDNTSKFIPSKENHEIITSPEGVEFISIGKESDNLLNLLLSKYGKNYKATIVNRISFTSLALEGGGPIIKNTSVRFKLFFEKGEVYFELFLVVDLQNNYIEIVEKDICYRGFILKALSLNA